MQLLILQCSKCCHYQYNDLKCCVTATKPFMSVHNYTCLVHTPSHFKENAVVSPSLNAYSDS